MLRKLSLALVVIALVPTSCKGSDLPEIEAEREIVVSSNSFQGGGDLPRFMTCDGGGAQPDISWERVTEAAEYLLTLVDPDAPGGSFVHWVTFMSWTGTEVLVDADPIELPNDFRDNGYGPPCPPEGDDAHRYVFTVYALDRPFAFFKSKKNEQPIDVRSSLDEVLEAIDCCVLAKGTLTATYER